MNDGLTVEKIKKAIAVLNSSEVPDGAVHIPWCPPPTQEEKNNAVTNSILELFGVNHG